MQTELFMYFCIMNCIGTKGEVCRQLKYFKPQVVYATDHSKAVVAVLFLILCNFVVYTTGCLMFYSLLVHLFVCFFACMSLSFFCPSWCRGLAAVCDCGIPLTFLSWR